MSLIDKLINKGKNNNSKIELKSKLSQIKNYKYKTIYNNKKIEVETENLVLDFKAEDIEVTISLYPTLNAALNNKVIFNKLAMVDWQKYGFKNKNEFVWSFSEYEKVLMHGLIKFKIGQNEFITGITNGQNSQIFTILNFANEYVGVMGYVSNNNVCLLKCGVLYFNDKFLDKMFKNSRILISLNNKEFFQNLDYYNQNSLKALMIQLNVKNLDELNKVLKNVLLNNSTGFLLKKEDTLLKLGGKKNILINVNDVYKENGRYNYKNEVLSEIYDIVIKN